MTIRCSRALAVVGAALLLTSGATAATAAPAPQSKPGHVCTAKDLGNQSATIHLEKDTLANPNFRTARWTAKTLQLTLMSIPVGGDVGLEKHTDTDQLLRIESGHAKVMMGDEKHLGFVKMAGPDDAILVPHGTWHNIVNVGGEPLKLYSVYGPAHHPKGTVHVTQADDPGSKDPKPNPTIGQATPVAPFTADPGEKPMVFNIREASLANPNFRMAAWSGDTLQVTLMSLKPKEDIGLEMHNDVDQLIRVEDGQAMVQFGETKNGVRPFNVVRAGDAVLVPAGTWHNVINLSPKKPLKVYSVYGPKQHPTGTVQPTKPAEH